MITITWNFPNELGYPNMDRKNQDFLHTPNLKDGLTEKGMEFVAEMESLGIIPDVSHLSDAGFYDVLKVTKKPFVASHSDARAVCPNVRNLTDDMIRMLADKGGVAGINFEPTFLNRDQTDTKSRVSRMCDHVEHFIKIGGTECVGIGTDFDGIGGEFEIPDCTKMDLFFDELHRRKISDDVIDKIAFGNVARVIRDSMK